MKVILPVMTASGKSYASTEDFLAKVHGETSGNWLLNVSAHWHGGIHLSDANCAPNAKLTDDLIDANKVTGLQSMTDGHIVAYRLNDTYCTAPYSGSRGAKNLRFSSSFILIKSTCQPDVAQPNDSLDFYTLWLHLAPLSEYHGRRYCIIKANNLSLREDNVSSGWISSGMPSSLAATAENKASYEAPHKIPSARLAKGAVLEIVDGANNFFLIDERNGNSKIHPFYRVKLASSEAVVGTSLEGREFWVSASQEHVTLAGAVMPEWMLFAQRRGVFNSVVNLSEAEMLPIQAGGLVGHLGLREDPIPHSNNIASGYNTHLEVFTDDSRLPAFMDNTAGLTTGVHFVKVLQDKSLFYFRPTEETFVPMEIAGDRMQTYEELIIEENRLEKKTQDGKSWYRVTSGGWLPESDVELVNQFDLTGRGFTRLEQDTPPTDIRAGTRESWFRKGMEFLHAATEKSRNFSYATHPRAYARVLSEMDENGDGQISPDELKRYFHHNRPDLVPIVDSFVVKHQSEWYHDGSASAWGAAMASMEKFEWGLAEYTKAFIDQLIWVKEVPTLSDGAAWWHMHPVVFLDALRGNHHPKTIVNGELTPMEFLDFYTGEQIDESDYIDASNKLRCEVAAIKAVAKTETGTSGSYFKFKSDDDHVPAILFERHHFHKYTGGRFDYYSDISNKISGGYGKESEQYEKLFKAYTLDKRAALMSASWGKFQMLASNYSAAGYSSPESFVLAMSQSEKLQLRAFVSFIHFDATLLRAIRAKDWLSFALRYNGPNQHGYDLKIERNYNESL